MSHDTLSAMEMYCDEYERDEDAALEHTPRRGSDKRRSRRQPRKTHTPLGFAARNTRRSTFRAMSGGKLKLAVETTGAA